MSDHHEKQCALCRVAAVRAAGRLCASCSEMIARLSRIATEATAKSLVPKINGLDRPMQPDREAQLFERALRINIFNIADYKRSPEMFQT